MIIELANGLMNFTMFLMILYALFTIGLLFYWWKIPKRSQIGKLKPVFITIVIAVRNEAQNILNILQDLNEQNYPKAYFEILIMDDGSSDETASLVTKFINQTKCSIRLINLDENQSKSPKKRAIETGIQLAKGSLISTTDGDCRLNKDWLRAIAIHYQATGDVVISGPVTFIPETTIFNQIQIVEFASLVVSGASSISSGFPTMCNGANLTYEKKAFVAVNGFEGVNHIASGDDEFLLHKLADKYPNKIGFLKQKEGIVFTKSHKNVIQFIRQRQRWASKWKHYKIKTPKWLAIFIFLVNFSLILMTALHVAGYISINQLSTLWLLKCIPEWPLVGSTLFFLNQRKSIKFVGMTQLIYPFYICFFGLLGQQAHYIWKGRKLE